ncbi:PREDICTED: uncharacterized protein LOC105127956 [Populus euphratica]|uniref:Uncharacterized protein LOC105127956 n=1 Tax=Populus euphratica TaxID=75702 RepID=A0AAJ6UF73_POPEU|nr:PREDICTED: uncharacterized protein LOC105127956 [Populus euphratica]
MMLREFNLFLLAFSVILACICRIKKHLGQRRPRLARAELAVLVSSDRLTHWVHGEFKKSKLQRLDERLLGRHVWII